MSKPAKFRKGDPEHRRRTCGDKVPYRSNVGAAQAIARMRARGNFTCDPGYKMSAYRCPYCKSWHVGHRADPKAGTPQQP